MNRVILMGRLTREPDIRYTQGGNPMCIARYTLAVDRRFSRNNNDGNNADFISCVAFGRSGEFAEKYLHKGTKIAVTGRIQTGSYTNRDGVKVYTTDVIVEDQEFAESKAAEQRSQQSGYQQPQQNSQGGYQQPQQNSQQGSYQQPQQNSQGGYQQPQQNSQGGYQQPQQNSQQGSYQQGDLDGFMSIPDGIDEELPFA